MKKIYKYKHFSKIIYYKIVYPVKLLKYTAKKWKKLNLINKIKKVNINKHTKLRRKQKSLRRILYKLRIKKRFKRYKIFRRTFKKRFLQKFKKKRKKSKNELFINFFLVKSKRYSWERKKAYSKDQKLSKLIWTLFFNNSKLLKSLKKFNKKNSHLGLINYFYKPVYYLSIFLWIINAAISVAHAKQIIQTGNIMVNTRVMTRSILLKKGDVVSFNELNNNFTEIKYNINKYTKFLTFIEVDFYTYRIVIIKNIIELTNNDLIVFSQQYFNLKTL